MCLGGMMIAPRESAQAEEQEAGGSEWVEVPALSGDIVCDQGWIEYPDQGDNGILFSVTKGAKASLCFYGTGIRWIGQKDINFGTALVYLDGELEAEVDTNGSAQWGITHFEKTGLEPGIHTLSIEAKEQGVVNVSGGVDIEKFVVQYDSSAEIPASSVNIITDLSDVDTRDRITLEAVVSPFNASAKNVIYTSSDNSIAEVDENGKVTIHKAGTVTFTASVNGSDVSDSKEVTIADVNLPERRMEVNNENPLLLVHLYGGNVEEGAEIPGIPGQGGATLLGTWNMIPDKVKPYTAVQLHPGFLGANDSETLRTYFEKNLELAQENNISIYLTVITGGNSNPMAIDWVNEMFDKYSCLKGLVATENWYGGDHVPNNMADYLEAAAKKGGYFVWTDANLTDHAMERWMNIDKLYNAAQRYSDNFIICSKSTASSGFANVRSVGMGYWLSDLCSNWGALTDSWYWYEKSYWRLFDQREAPYRTVGGSYSSEEVRCPFQFPETMYSMNMLQTYANGGVVFNFEHPFYCTGVNDIPSHALTEAILPVMEYIIDNPAPTKKEVTEATKVVFSSREGYMPSDFQYGLYGDENDGNLMQNSGRYNTIPIIHSRVDESVLERFDAVIDLDDIQGMTTEEKTEWFNQYYPEISEGDAYVQRIHTEGNPRWLVFNSNDNQNVNQSAAVFTEGAASENISFELTPHTYLLAEQTEDGVEIALNNYRADKDEIWEDYDGDYEDRWNGDWNNYCQEYMLANYLPNPKIDELRPTVISFTLPAGSEKPELEITGDEGQYEYTESYEKETGAYSLTVNHNGQVNISLKEDGRASDVDKTALKELIDMANSLDSADYTAESFAVMKSALASAQAVYDNEQATEAEVKEAETALQSAVEALVKVEDPGREPGTGGTSDTAGSNNKTNSTPKTGDAASMAVVIPVLLAALAVVSAAALRKKIQ